MATYTRTSTAIPGLALDWDDVVVWPTTGPVGPTTTLTFNNSDGTSSVITGTNLTLNASGLPTNGNVTQLQRFAGLNGTGSLLETVNSFSFTLTLINLHANLATVAAYLYAGGDSMTGGSLADDLLGYAGDDSIFGNGGDDLISGGDGDDNMRGGAGNDTVDGGAGGDEARYDTNSAGAVTATLTDALLPGGNTGGSATSSTEGTDTLINIEALRGTNNATGDSLTGNGQNNSFRGLSGADTITGGAGTDEVRYDRDVNYSGGTGAVNVNLAFDTVTGEGRATDGFGTVDRLFEIEMVRGTNNAIGDTLTGGNPANGIYANQGFEGFRGLGGADTIDGGVGYDESRYDRDSSEGGTAGITFNLSGGNAGNNWLGSATDGFGHIDVLRNVEGARGTNASDTFTGNLLQNKFFGLDGNDSFVLGDGFDYVEPGAGNDTVNGSPVNQIDQAYDDRDFVSYDDFGSAGIGVFIDLDINTFVDPTGGIDVITDIERLRGTSAADVFLGSNTANLRDELFQGLAGNDTFDGRAGFDIVDYSRDTVEGGNLGIVANLTTGIATDGFGHTDRLYYIESIRGTNTHDQFIGDGGRNTFRVFGGNDTVNGGDGRDAVDMFVDDTLTGPGATVNLQTASATGIAGGVSQLTSIEDIFGSASTDNLTGNGEGNQINGWLGSDTIDGAAGNDLINGHAGADSLTGGDDFDIVSFLYDPTIYTYYVNIFTNEPQFSTPWGGVTVNLGTGTAVGFDLAVDTISGFEGVVGTFSADSITGNGSDNIFYGLSGNDTIIGGGGIDTISYAQWNGDGRVLAPIPGVNASDPNGVVVNLTMGSASNDGEGGSDSLTGITNVVGSRGNDTITGTSGNNTIDGGDGTDVVVFSGVRANYTITQLVGQGAIQVFSVADGTDILRNVEILRFTDPLDENVTTPGFSFAGTSGADEQNGGDGNDTMDGGTGGDYLVSGDGNDTVSGGADPDEIFTGDGDDSADGGTGNDTIVGGSGLGNDTYNGGVGGSDTVVYTSTTTGIVVNLAAASNQATGSEIDTDQLIDIENIIGGTGGDSITGNSVANNLMGDAGNDTIDGAGGNDTLAGGAGNDTLTGGQGADYLSGDSNNDVLNGGAGNDTLDGGANDLAGADIADFALAKANYHYQVYNDGGALGLKVGSSGEGVDTIIGIETLRFNGVGVSTPTNLNPSLNKSGNVVGSAFEDVTFHNDTTGQSYVNIFTNGALTASGALTGNNGAQWDAIDSADMNGDGTADVIYKNTADGSIAIGTMSASGVTGYTFLTTALSTTWRLVGAADFDGDTYNDLLIQNNSTGFIYTADFTNLTFNQYVPISNEGTAWQARALGDVNGDGRADIIYQNTTTTQIVAGLMSASGTLSSYQAIATVGNWTVKEAADVNNDGFEDVLIQNNANGDISYANMAGGNFSGYGTVMNGFGTAWQLEGMSDTNNDGDVDAIIRNVLGSSDTYIVNMEGGAFQSFTLVAQGIGSQWYVV